MIISLIAAVDENFLIGSAGKIPWNLPADMQHFKSITNNKPVIMGRKTFESIGKALPGRRNIVLSKNPEFYCKKCEVYPSLIDAIQAVKQFPEIMIIGGANVYQETLPLAEKIYLTIVHAKFKGDVFFPKLNSTKWQEIAHKDFLADDNNRYAYSFLVFKKLYHNNDT